MKQFLTTFLFIISNFIILFGQNNSGELVQLNTGEWKSEKLNFIVNFPSRPNYIDNSKVYTNGITEHIFQYNENKYLSYSLVCNIYPETYTQSINRKEVLDNLLNQYAATMPSIIVKKEYKNTENTKELYFEFKSKDTSVGGFVYGRIIIYKNKIYRLIYGGTSLGNHKDENLKFITDFNLN